MNLVSKLIKITYKNFAFSDIMISVSLVNSIIRLTTFVFTFVQRISYAYYNWFKKHYSHFATHWLEFAPKQTSISYDLSDQLLGQTLEEDSESTYVTIPFKSKSNPDTPKQNDFSTWQVRDAREIARSSNQGLISAKTQNNLWMKIKEIADSHQPHDEKTSEATVATENSQNRQEELKRTNNKKRLNHQKFLSGATTKLEEYGKKNQEYLFMKNTNGSDVDNYSFMHPYAYSAFSRKTRLLLKNPRPRCSKKRPLPFRPTELSIIFESLGY